MRIQTSSLDGPFAGEFSYDSFDGVAFAQTYVSGYSFTIFSDSQYSLTQWMHANPLYPEAEAFESGNALAIFSSFARA